MLNRKPDPLQWQRSMGVRRGAKEQLSERSQRKSMIDISTGSRLQYQQPRSGKDTTRGKRLEPADSYESMQEVALHRNKVVRKNEGRSPKIKYSQAPSLEMRPAARATTTMPGIDDAAVPELDVSDVGEAQSWKLESQTTYLETVTAANDPYQDERRAASIIQRFVRVRMAAKRFEHNRPETRHEPLPSLDSSPSMWDDVAHDSQGDFQRSKPLHRLIHGEDPSRLRFYQLYSTHLDWMDEESHTELGLHRTQEDGWRREEIISILHQLSHSNDARDIRERCADVGIVLCVSESENPDEVRRILRKNLQYAGAQKSTGVATVDSSARAKRLELMAKQRSAHHQFLEECLQRGVHPLPIMLHQDRNGGDDAVLDLAHYRMGNEIAAALAAGLNKRAACMRIETLILTDNNLSGPRDQLRGSQRTQSASIKGPAVLSSGAAAIASIINQNADSIIHLDLSENPLGLSGCQVLAKAFANNSRALAVKTLRLNNCKLGDKGARALLRLLGEWCPYLTSLDIGHNNLGQVASAALALEEIIREETVPLSTLSLHYNNFGEKHMRRFASAIPENTFLTHLDLSWNSLGCEGAMILAQSLRKNEMLKVLDVTHDQIQEKGAFVLADMLKENRGLEKVILSDNPIGQRGGRAVLRAINRMVELGMAHTRQVVLSQCNYNFSTADTIFDPATPGGTYECDLTKPYDRAVAWELVELAWKEEGENWENETIDNQPFDLPEPEEGEVWGRNSSFGPGCWYQLPAEGVLRVTYRQTPKVPRFSDCIDSEMVDKLIELMSDKLINDHGTMLVTLAALDFYFTAKIACSLTILTRDTVNKVTCVSALIPRIIDPINMSSDCYDWMTVSELAALERRSPDLFNFIPCNPTNHYKLELGRTDHRRMLSRLVCICAEDKAFREKFNMYDTSQKGDGEGWRNETMTTSEALMGPPVINDSVDWKAPLKQYQPFQQVPWDIEEEDATGGRLKYGTLEFDFVSTNVAHRVVGQAPMPPAIFRFFLKELQAIEDMVTVLAKGTDAANKKKRIGSKKSRLYRERSTAKPATTKPEESGRKDDKGVRAMRSVKTSVTVAHALQAGKPIVFNFAEVVHIMKVQAFIRGKLFRNSAKGIAVTPYSALQRASMKLIHKERLKFQHFSKLREQQVQQTRQKAKEAMQQRVAETMAMQASKSQSRVAHFRSQIVPQHRPCWWTPSQEKQVSASSAEVAKSMVRDKQLQMLRRSTMQFFFSSQQVTAILDVIDAGPDKKAHVEALVILFAVITDIECVKFAELLGHTTYDKDGNHVVDWNELKALRLERNPWVVLESRLGPANLFNPIRPEREYALDLRQSDCRMVAQCLVVISAERGENLMYTSYNGLPFEVGAKWIDAVPDLGMFCGQFVTPNGCALMSIRLAIARRLLMPGFGRWRAVPPELRSADEDWRTQDASIGLEHCFIDSDGSLVERQRDEEEDPTALSMGGLVGALRFSRKLKNASSKRLQELKVRAIDMKAASPLSLVVKLSLAAQRAKENAATKQETTFATLRTMLEGETVQPGAEPSEPDGVSSSGAVAGIAGAFSTSLLHRDDANH